MFNLLAMARFVPYFVIDQPVSLPLKQDHSGNVESVPSQDKALSSLDRVFTDGQGSYSAARDTRHVGPLLVFKSKLCQSIHPTVADRILPGQLPSYVIISLAIINSLTL